MSVPINPETKVGVLLDAYPGIEEVLIAWVPAFEKLRNPILRKTVAKVATLEQAARVGGVSVRELVEKLREAAGQSGESFPIAHDPGPGGATPGGLLDENQCHVFDADNKVETSVHPIGKVRECVATLQPGEFVRLTSSFRPEPLIETMRRGGLAVFCEETSPGRHSTYIARPE